MFPFIVMSTYIEPVEGYSDTLLGALGGSIGLTTGIIRVAQMHQENCLDYVAADITVNSILAIAETRAANIDKYDDNIFNIVNTGEKLDGRE